MLPSLKYVVIAVNEIALVNTTTNNNDRESFGESLLSSGMERWSDIAQLLLRDSNRGVERRIRLEILENEIQVLTERIEHLEVEIYLLVQ